MSRAALGLWLALWSLPVWADDGCERALTREADAIIERAASRVAPVDDLPARLESAQKFQAFFGAVQKHLLERDEMLDMTELALLAKEHVLLMGPPGNAKSKLAKTVLSSMLEAKAGDSSALVPSFYRIQMTPETTMSETHGPLDFKILTDTGRQERIYDQGMLMSRNVFIDEIFDARANANRNVLGLLNEREHAQGPNIVPGRIETVIAATNKYISEVYEKVNDESPKALLDRFAFTVFVPKDLEYVDSYLKLLQAGKGQVAPLAPLRFEDIDRLRAMTDEVELPTAVIKALTLLSRRIALETENMEQSSLKTYREKVKNGEEAPPPYRATKYMSPRTLVKAGYVLRAIVVQDWVRSGGNRPLVANLADVAKLRTFFTLNGPADGSLQRQLAKATNAHERVQLMAIAQEREIFDRHYSEILEAVDRSTVKFDLAGIEAQLDGPPSAADKGKLGNHLVQILSDGYRRESDAHLADDLSGEDIGLDLVENYARVGLRRLWGEKYEAEMAKLEQVWAKQLAAEKTEAERIAAEKLLEARRLQQEAKLAEARAERFLQASIEPILENVDDGHVAIDAEGPAFVHLGDHPRELRVKHRTEPERIYDASEIGALGKFISEPNSRMSWRIDLLDRDTIVLFREELGTIFKLGSGRGFSKFKVPEDPKVSISANRRKLVTFDENTRQFTVVDWAKKTQIKVRSHNSKDQAAEVLTRILNYTADIFVSDDGKKAYVASQGGIVEKNLATGTLKVVCEFNRRDEQWNVVAGQSSDGRIFFVRKDDEGLTVREQSLDKTFTEYLIPTTDSLDADYARVSPDGSTIYLLEYEEIVRVDLVGRSLVHRSFDSGVSAIHFVDANQMVVQLGEDLVRLKFAEGK